LLATGRDILEKKKRTPHTSEITSLGKSGPPLGSHPGVLDRLLPPWKFIIAPENKPGPRRKPDHLPSIMAFRGKLAVCNKLRGVYQRFLERFQVS